VPIVKLFMPIYSSVSLIISHILTGESHGSRSSVHRVLKARVLSQRDVIVLCSKEIQSSVYEPQEIESARIRRSRTRIVDI
jgi:hypothetical protein